MLTGAMRGSEPGPHVLGYLLRAQVDQGLAPDALEVGGVAAVDRLRVRPAEHLEHNLVAVLVRVRPAADQAEVERGQGLGLVGRQNPGESLPEGPAVLV